METILPGYIRVSDILAIFKGIAHIPKEILERKGEIGTEVHEAITQYFKGNLPILSEEANPYFNSFLEWSSSLSPELLTQDKRYYPSGFKVTGKIDLLARVKGEIWLIDFKTQAVATPSLWKLQLFFYDLLMEQCEKTYPLPSFLSVLHLQKDGSFPKVFKYSVESKEHKENRLMRCIEAYSLYNFFFPLDKNRGEL